MNRDCHLIWESYAQPLPERKFKTGDVVVVYLKDSQYDNRKPHIGGIIDDYKWDNNVKDWRYTFHLWSRPDCTYSQAEKNLQKVTYKYDINDVVKVDKDFHFYSNFDDRIKELNMFKIVAHQEPNIAHLPDNKFAVDPCYAIVPINIRLPDDLIEGDTIETIGEMFISHAANVSTKNQSKLSGLLDI